MKSEDLELWRHLNTFKHTLVRCQNHLSHCRYWSRSYDGYRPIVDSPYSGSWLAAAHPPLRSASVSDVTIDGGYYMMSGNVFVSG